MNDLIAHRGPDDSGIWVHERGHVGFAHRRLSIIDLAHGHQPMSDEAGNWITYNGEIYNYLELRADLAGERFAHRLRHRGRARRLPRAGAPAALDQLRGMFAFALWDERRSELFCARDRFGIKPFVLRRRRRRPLLRVRGQGAAAVPAVGSRPTPRRSRTTSRSSSASPARRCSRASASSCPATSSRSPAGPCKIERYWEVYYDLDCDHTARWFERAIEELLHESVRLHLRSDVPVARLPQRRPRLERRRVGRERRLGRRADEGVHRQVLRGPAVRREPLRPASSPSRAASSCTRSTSASHDFLDDDRDVIYHLDYPAAGPGSFPQYMVSQPRPRALQGHPRRPGRRRGLRRLRALPDRLLRAVHQGRDRRHDARTATSSSPTSRSSRTSGRCESYKPLLRAVLARRPVRGPRRALLPPDQPRARPRGGGRLRGARRLRAVRDVPRRSSTATNVGHESYFDKMTHFDFKTLLPALLQVEDRVSMAHGLESRVPLLDHRLVEFAATIPADSKFKDGHMKHVFKEATRPLVPGRRSRTARTRWASRCR